MAALPLATMPQLAEARELVGFSAGYSSGTVVVKISERKLYYVLGNGQAVRYSVGVGRAGKQWTGTAVIDGKQLSPAWSPPADVRHDKPTLPPVIPGGSPANLVRSVLSLVLKLYLRAASCSCLSVPLNSRRSATTNISVGFPRFGIVRRKR